MDSKGSSENGSRRGSRFMLDASGLSSSILVLMFACLCVNRR